jgi:hypothetical protein
MVPSLRKAPYNRTRLVYVRLSFSFFVERPWISSIAPRVCRQDSFLSLKRYVGTQWICGYRLAGVYPGTFMDFNIRTRHLHARTRLSLVSATALIVRRSLKSTCQVVAMSSLIPLAVVTPHCFISLRCLPALRRASIRALCST